MPQIPPNNTLDYRWYVSLFFSFLDCGKVTNTSMFSGTIRSPLDTINKSCQWNIELPPRYTSFQIDFHDLNLRICTNCSCDYIEVWNSRNKDPKQWVGKFCGDLKDKYIGANHSNHLLVEFGSSSSSGMKSNHTFLSYRGFEVPTTTPPSTGKYLVYIYRYIEVK